ncbi:hypothetical protein M9H77_35422 [Catharanthus roseus]|uniref:Uncharacterized protein n=1 Tax=Catharanthus roseus TaxID=4058 RepID=A0ACB9ZNY9_CATRO|nr:hypothetical protein M9H77_35422 [Catharanthus roseus]
MLGSVTLDLDPVDRGCSTVGGLGPRCLSWCMHVFFLKISGVVVAPICLDSLRLFGLPRGMQIPYSVAVDLAEGYGVSQSRQFETARANRLAAEVAQIRGAPEVQRRGTKMSKPHSMSHEAEAMPESSSHGWRNAASHEIIENFMMKMTELLEAMLANRRGERAQNTSNDEALERFLRFWPSEFHGKIEQEAKVELFLEQLNDIYDTLQYKGARRVTFTAFRLRGAEKDWWFRIFELGY